MQYKDAHEQRVEIFKDTLGMIQESPELSDALEKSIGATQLYGADETPEFSEVLEASACEVTVTKYRTFEAAGKLAKKYPGKKVAVLNFASATNPGGGVVHGSGAQEECLCRCSTLYPCLANDALWKPYYRFHRERFDTTYTDACIYTPGVKVIKSDTALPERLPQEEWFTVDVITCAAPNLRYAKILANELLDIHLSRGRKILSVAAANGVDVLVLGAFGCGAFGNDPKIVAEAYRRLLGDFARRFTAVEFAVYCSPRDVSNFDAFCGTFQGALK